ncbi:hypothetical protein [Desulfonatronovibrio magnus]|uniref:hypothetical protein n=1 Tax=Desulfonatronovibrio magnus TaxID=698827 RepID=UPI0006981FB3|nr:hypothetical protein [Desulfonatronovibrio magnus]
MKINSYWYLVDSLIPRCLCFKVLKCFTLILFTFCLLAAVTGCGKKEWPEPDDSAEKFTISISNHEFSHGCLNIQALIDGNIRNLSLILLEIEGSDEPCPACPFLVTDTFAFQRDSKGLTMDGSKVSIRQCGLNPDLYYRARLRAVNIYPMIRDTVSSVSDIIYPKP